MSKDDKPNVRGAVRNWKESDLGFFTKLRVAARNELRKAARLKRCCGNPGEPGC